MELTEVSREGERELKEEGENRIREGEGEGETGRVC